MVSPNTRMPNQEMPPPGGFKPFNVARELPAAKIRGMHLFGGVALTCAVGLYVVGQGNIRRRAVKLERRERRTAMIPFLQAEEDARFVREEAKYLDMEARVMADVPGWVPGQSVYNTRDWVAPA